MHLFDEGWNKLREKIFANEKRLGVIPPDAKLTPWPSGPPASLPMWDSLTADQKRLYIRQIDIWAAYMAYTDYEIGRIYEPVYLCRRWEGNSDSALPFEVANRYDLYKDWLRTIEIRARMRMRR